MKNKNILKQKRKIFSFFSYLRDRKKIKYNRVLPLNEYLSNRWEKANYLQWGEGSNCYDNVYVFGDVQVGENTFVGPFCILDGGGGLRIGKFCSISAGVQIYTHNSVQWSHQGGGSLEYAPVVIEDYCYIGPNSVISMGVTIGKGAIVGACSFVNKNVPPYTKVAGCPARIISTNIGGNMKDINPLVCVGGGDFLKAPALLWHRRAA
ncbi:acyltransferase [Helicobacter sp. UBA3407]|uniref:acyltransferase n=1 Tax=Helicobacter TaxID=209 RepID=UPI00261C5B55|nr:acyltransferase [Helicobacter sp. UBA3407]